MASRDGTVALAHHALVRQWVLSQPIVNVFSLAAGYRQLLPIIAAVEPEREAPDAVIRHVLQDPRDDGQIEFIAGSQGEYRRCATSRPCSSSRPQPASAPRRSGRWRSRTAGSELRGSGT